MNNKDKEMLADGETLASFSNLTDAEIGDFRKKNPGFVPEAWWRTKVAVESEPTGVALEWKSYQRVLQSAWQGNPKFSLEDSVRLIAAWSPPDASFTGVDSSEVLYAPSNMISIPLSDAGRYGVGSPSLPIFEAQVWPYQRAVMLLAIDSWRARTCLHCSKRFFADMPKRLYCSPRCSGDSHTAAKRRWFRAHGSEWRATRKKKPSSTRWKRNGKRRS